MAHKAIIRMLNSVSRHEIEKRLGGNFEPIPDAPGRRQNGRFVTFKDYSKQVQGRIDCFVLPLMEGAKAISGRTWTDVAKAIEGGKDGWAHT